MSSPINPPPPHSSKQPSPLVPSGSASGSSEELAENFIRAIEDPTKLQDLLIDSYRRFLSLEKSQGHGRLILPPPPPENVQGQVIQAVSESVNEVGRQDIYNQVSAVLEQELKCSICTELFIDPSVLHCGHTFCHHCITTWIHANRPNPSHCPVCRKSLVLRPVSKHVGIGNFLTKIHTVLPAHIQANRDQIIRERQEVTNNAAVVRATIPSQNPMSNINPVHLRYISANRERAMTMGAALLLVAERLPNEITGSGSIPNSVESIVQNGVNLPSSVDIPTIISEATQALIRSEAADVSHISLANAQDRTDISRISPVVPTLGVLSYNNNERLLRHSHRMQQQLSNIRSLRETRAAYRASSRTVEIEADQHRANVLRQREIATETARLRVLDVYRNLRSASMARGRTIFGRVVNRRTPELANYSTNSQGSSGSDSAVTGGNLLRDQMDVEPPEPERPYVRHDSQAPSSIISTIAQVIGLANESQTVPSVIGNVTETENLNRMWYGAGNGDE